MPDLIYLASPHSHENELVREQRFHTVVKIAADLISLGNFVFCPIAHTHHIGIQLTYQGSTAIDFQYWKKYDTFMLGKCQILAVATMPGWKESKGVQAEINIAIGKGIPIIYISGE